MDTIDLRSDTVTWPTAEMREAMMSARIGDDVYGEDTTVNELEAEAASMLGKEAGLYVPSGTMSNATAVLTHCGRGDEMILGDKSHIFRAEAGGSSALGGVHPYTLPVQPDGTLELDAIREAIRQDNDHYPRTRLICLENTQATVGGAVLTADYTAQVARIARDNGLQLHIDGARLFNAAAALNADAKSLVAGADTVSICLSKGLCAPVGSVLVGSKDFIQRARRTRKQLGGGMRQAGFLAAAGLVALRQMAKRLGDDHTNARTLAEGLATAPCVKIDPAAVKTNIFYFEVLEGARLNADQLSERLKNDYNIFISPYPSKSQQFRIVTHYWITPERVNQTIEAVRTLLS